MTDVSQITRLSHVLQPKSIAVVGVSQKPGTAAHAAISFLTLNDYAGDLHLVGRSGGELDGRKTLTDVSELPQGVDCAILAIPAAAVLETVQGLVARRVRSAVIFAGGFAELGEEQRGVQDKIGEVARAGGLSIVGPNCLGFTNFVDRVGIGFAAVRPIARLPSDVSDAVAIVAQSGGLGGHLYLGLTAKNIPVSYMISTGNEVDVGLADFLHYLIEDKVTRVITVYAEAIRRPAAFMEAARAARARGKAVVMLHSGRGAKAQEAAKSHTGALAGDYPLMRALVMDAGVTLVESLDELMDVTEVLTRFPKPANGGLGVLTFSGAFCGIAYDFCDDLGVDIPPLSPSIEAALKPQVPAFIPPRNPLDLGTQPIWQPELVRIGAEALMAEPEVGALAISIPIGSPQHAINYSNALAAAFKTSDKPRIVTMLGDTAALPEEFLKVATENKFVLSRSSDRMLRAMAKVLEYGRCEFTASLPAAPSVPKLPDLQPNAQPEWLGKQILTAIGVPVPKGRLARTIEEAVAFVKDLDAPVAMKAQAGALAHKTEAGAVLLNISGESAVREAWDKLIANVTRAEPNIKLDGILVEAMSQRGVELVIGARRDPLWGPILLIGLGGIWVEALRDVRLVPAHANKEQIIKEIRQLRSARLLDGFRGMPAVDVDAVAQIAVKIGGLMRARHDIVEIDLNPVMVHAVGQGATALDALIVTH